MALLAALNASTSVPHSSARNISRSMSRYRRRALAGNSIDAIKHLIGLYEPQGGRIEIGGDDFTGATGVCASASSGALA